LWVERRSSRFEGFGFSSVSAEKEREVDRAVGARAPIQRVDDMIGLPSPSGSPTTRRVPTSWMRSSAIAPGSEKSFGIDLPSAMRPEQAAPRGRLKRESRDTIPQINRDFGQHPEANRVKARGFRAGWFARRANAL
jgi:hypothetical protein